MPDVVIVGGNFAGAAIAHYVLLHVLPPLTTSATPYQVTMISPSNHTMFKIGAPRALVDKKILADNALFHSIPENFKKYKNFVFVEGQAVAVDESSKTITVKGQGEATSNVHYDSLIIATGTSPNSPLWGLVGNWTSSKAAIEKLQEKLPKAKTIVVAGGGAVGVETAGELATHYKSADITLLSGSARLLERVKNLKIGSGAESKLKGLGVKVVHKIRVVEVIEDAPGGPTTLKFSDGTSRKVDIYLDCTGGKPNTGFLPPAWLDQKGRLGADAETLRATSAPAGVYGVGDVTSYSQQSAIETGNSIRPLGYSLQEDLAKAAGKKATLKPAKLKQLTEDMMVAPVGPKGGVGILNGFKIPSFMVWMVKSRTFFMNMSPQVANGSAVAKA